MAPDASAGSNLNGASSDGGQGSTSENQSVVGGLSEAPLTSYRLLPARSTAAVVTALLAVAAAGWVYTVNRVDSMSDMVTGLGQVGHLMPDTMAVTGFFAMWVAMMTAMMCPALAPVVLAHRAMLRRRNEVSLPA